MDNIKKKIEDGELKTVSNTKGKAQYWTKFKLVTTLQDEPTRFVQCSHFKKQNNQLNNPKNASNTFSK